MSRNIFLVIILLLSVALQVLAVPKSNAVTAGGAPVRPLNILSLSFLSSGGGSISNREQLVAFMVVPIAIKHFNERYGKLVPAVSELPSTCNATLRLVGDSIYDDFGIASVAVTELVTRYTNQQIDVVHGVVKSEVAQSVAVIAGALKIPMVSFYASADALSNKYIYPTFFRLITTTPQFAEMTCRLYQFYGYKTAVLILPADVGIVDFGRYMFDECEKLDIRLVVLSFDSSKTGEAMMSQMRQVLKPIFNERINCIFNTLLTYDAMWAIAQVLHENNWIDGKMLLSHLTYINPALLFYNAPNVEVLKHFFDGMVHIVRGNDINPLQSRTLREEYAKFNVDDVIPFLPNASTVVLDADFFIKDASVAPKYRTWPSAYDSIMTIGLAACGSKPSLLQNMAELKFDGTSGAVSFDKNFDREVTGVLFSLENMHFNKTGLDYSQVEVGRAINGTWTLYDSPRVMYSGGKSEPPLDITPPLHNIEWLPMSAKIFGWIEASLVILGGTLWLGYIALHRRDKDVNFHTGGPLAMALLAVGCISMGVSIIGLSLETNAGCMVFNWCFALGFVMCMTVLTAISLTVEHDTTSSLGSKHNNAVDVSPPQQQDRLLVNAVVVENNSNTVKGENPPKGTYYGKFATVAGATGTFWFLSAGTMIATVGTLIAFQVVAPAQFGLLTTQRDAAAYPLHSAAVCMFVTGSALTTQYFTGLCVLYCISMLLMLGAAFRIRAVSVRNKISATVEVFLFQILFVGVSAAAAVWITTLPRFLVLTSIPFLLSMVMLFTMWLPRLSNWRFVAEGLCATKFASSSRPMRNTTTSGFSRMAPSTQGGGTVMVESMADRSKRTAIASMPTMPVFMNGGPAGGEVGMSEEQVSDTPSSGTGGSVLSSIKHALNEDQQQRTPFHHLEPQRQMSATELMMSGITTSNDVQQSPQRQLTATKLMMSGITSGGGDHQMTMHTPPTRQLTATELMMSGITPSAPTSSSVGRQPTATELMMSGISAAPMEQPLLGPTSMVTDGGSMPPGPYFFGRPYPFLMGGNNASPAAGILLSGAPMSSVYDLDDDNDGKKAAVLANGSLTLQ